MPRLHLLSDTTSAGLYCSTESHCSTAWQHGLAVRSKCKGPQDPELARPCPVVLFCRHCAVQACWAPGVDTLVRQGASIMTRTPAGDTPLLWAAYKGDLEIVQVLIGAGADVNVMGDLGNRPLHLAASADHPQVSNGLSCTASIATPHTEDATEKS